MLLNLQTLHFLWHFLIPLMLDVLASLPKDDNDNLCPLLFFLV